MAGGIVIKYRLKMNIGTDTSFYLDSASVNYEQTCGSGSVTENITISPNPVTDQLSVLIARNNPAKATITVHSISGQRIYVNTQSISGIRQILIPMKHLARGVYLVTVFINDKKELVKKVVRE